MTPLLELLGSLGFTCLERVSRNYVDITLCGRTNRFYLFGGRDESSAALIQGMTLCGVFLGSVYCSRVGVELKDDPEYQRRLAEGMITLKKNIAETAHVEATPEAKRSVWIFLTGAILVVLFDTIPGLRPDWIASRLESRKASITMVMIGATTT